MTSNRKFFIASVALAALLFAAFALLFQGTASAANPGPLAAPTPVSVTGNTGRGQAAVLWQAKVITEDTATGAMDILNYSKADIQWLIDQTVVAAAPNTTTVKLQFSNNGVNWIDGINAVATNSADAGDMQQFAMFGRYVRLYADVSNANPITLTLAVAAK